MNTFSHYVSDTPNTHQGLGRIPLRLMPAEPTKRRRVEQELKITNRSRLLPTNKATPVVKTPKKLAKPQPKPKATLKSKPRKPTKPKGDNATGHLPTLKGTFSVGGLEVKKTHAAVAGGGIIGSLLLWKIFF
ncbi:hypothetical protein NC796_02575 [Aliifodinibius sp. S!AR15-10]|uniref:hypothetical protein n=1 Tax=Aliifodinibius sp. S!AR15-10 TaxID=2950437 RepID=UPI00286039D9|nr:hypothetical protein [Aliifodinibius sp. S!AR15-10]MDR8390007.1 hypothetical protein [Aliifodinibius sp. S!AR15-10]